MRVLNFKDFMEKNNSKNDTMNESDLQRVNNYPIYPRNSKIYSDKGFVNIDDGSMGGSHWTVFLSKITNPFILIRLVARLINFYLFNYLNR